MSLCLFFIVFFSSLNVDYLQKKVASKQKRSNFLIKQDEEQHFFHEKKFIAQHLLQWQQKWKGNLNSFHHQLWGKKEFQIIFIIIFLFFSLSSVDLTLNSPPLMRTALDPQSSSFCGYLSYVVLNLKLMCKNFRIWKN